MLNKLIAMLLVFLSLSVLVATVALGVDMDSKDIIREVQQALNDAGYECGVADGVIGKKTKAAITQYRLDKGLSEGDTIDEELLKKLYLIVDEESVVMNSTLSKEMARASIVVAFTNRFATDVFTDDGNNYDPSKFHAYGDTNGFRLKVTGKGTVSKNKDGSVHVKKLKMQAVDYESSLFAVSADVKVDGDYYVVYNLEGTAPSYDDVQELEKAWDYEICFYVPSQLVPKDVKVRIESEDNSALQSVQNEKKENKTSSENSKKNELREDRAQAAFEIMGSYLYPYGFKCHWFTKKYAADQKSDGSWWFKVGVTITNAFGASYEATAEALVNNTTQAVEQFNVY